MDKDCFEKIKRNVIEKYIQELTDFDKKNGFNCLTVRVRRIDRVFYFYEKKRQFIRRYFMHLENKPMDRHKIASVIIYAILKSKIIYVDRTAMEIPDCLLMANEYLAVYTAISFIESYRKDDDKSNYSLTIPHVMRPIGAAYQDDGTLYINNMCKALYYISSDANKFDIFAYANIFFLLEKYTDDIEPKNK